MDISEDERPHILIEPKMPAPPTPTVQGVRQAAQNRSLIHAPDLCDALANIYAFILKRRAEHQQ